MNWIGEEEVPSNSVYISEQQLWLSWTTDTISIKKSIQSMVRKYVSCNIKREHMPKNVQALAWNSHKNVVGLNRFVGTPFWSLKAIFINKQLAYTQKLHTQKMNNKNMSNIISTINYYLVPVHETTELKILTCRPSHFTVINWTPVTTCRGGSRWGRTRRAPP